jgi:hypothetical protein
VVISKGAVERLALSHHNLPREDCRNSKARALGFLCNFSIF